MPRFEEVPETSLKVDDVIVLWYSKLFRVTKVHPYDGALRSLGCRGALELIGVDTGQQAAVSTWQGQTARKLIP